VTKTKPPPYYGRLGHDVDVAQVRDRIINCRAMLDEMDRMLDEPLTHEEAVATLGRLYDDTRVLMVMPMLRPIFLSHLIGRLVADGVTFSVIAEKVSTTRQKVNDLYYNGVGKAPTNVPRRTRRKLPVTGEQA